MKTYWTYLIALSILFSLAGAPASGASGDAVSVQATLIRASNDSNAIDRRLQKYESKLRKVFRFSSYQFLGEGRGKVTLPGETKFSIASAYRMEIKATPAKDNKVRAEIRWTKGNTTLINATVVMQKGTPTILGGPSHNGGNLIVILNVK